jgi:hypothetical protein
MPLLEFANRRSSRSSRCSKGLDPYARNEKWQQFVETSQMLLDN